MAASDLTILTNVKAWQSPPLASTADDALLTRLGARQPIPAVGFAVWIDRLWEIGGGR